MNGLSEALAHPRFASLMAHFKPSLADLALVADMVLREDFRHKLATGLAEVQHDLHLDLAPLARGLRTLQREPLAQAAQFIVLHADPWEEALKAFPQSEPPLHPRADEWWLEAVRTGDEVVLVPNEPSEVPRLALFAPSQRDGNFTVLTPAWAEWPYLSVHSVDERCQKGIDGLGPGCTNNVTKGCPAPCRSTTFRVNGRLTFRCWCP